MAKRYRSVECILALCLLCVDNARAFFVNQIPRTRELQIRQSRRDESVSSPPALKSVAIVAGSVGLAIGANFLGITSALLSNSGSSAQNTILADLYEINGFRRYSSDDKEYSYLVPDNWIPDRMVLMNHLKLRELPKELREKSSLQGMPDSAFILGEGGRRIDNVSVIKAKVEPGFEMRKTLGTPREALQYLTKSLAPTGSGKAITIIDAKEDADASGNLKYVFEYVVNKETWETGRHTVSIVMFKPPLDLYTATVVVGENEWPVLGKTAAAIAESFQLY